MRIFSKKESVDWTHVRAPKRNYIFGLLADSLDNPQISADGNKVNDMHNDHLHHVFLSRKMERKLLLFVRKFLFVIFHVQDTKFTYGPNSEYSGKIRLKCGLYQGFSVLVPSTGTFKCLPLHAVSNGI